MTFHECWKVHPSTPNCAYGHTEIEAVAREVAALVNDKLAAERATLALSQPSSKPLDIGRCPMTESPLFGGDPQLDLF